MEQQITFFFFYLCLMLMIWLARHSVFGLEELRKSQWVMLQRNIGVSAMHMQLLPNDRVVVFDRTDFGPSNISLAGGRCRHDPNDQALPVDCTAHSVEYNVAGNNFRPLTVLTDTWCSSGGLAADGHLVQTGGFNDGDRAARFFLPCPYCDWSEAPAALAVPRWYATNQALPDGRSVIVGGRREFSYEFYPKSASSVSATPFEFLRQTNDAGAENNLYPFVHLNVDGNLFVFANNRAVLLDYRTNKVVKTFPAMPGGDPRNYPSSGSSVLLPLASPTATAAEVLICGGAPAGSFQKSLKSKAFVGGLTTCGRMTITSPSPEWSMETMPMARVMGDMILLPTGDVLIINGASLGTAGWELGRSPAMSPVVYLPDRPHGDRFEVETASETPRMYHSSAILLRDGRILVGGSNPHATYQFYNEEFPTDLSLEAFLPDYLHPSNYPVRPIIKWSPVWPVRYGRKLTVWFRIPAGMEPEGVTVTVIAPSFATHSFSMNQRMIVLGHGGRTVFRPGSVYSVEVSAPSSPVLAPRGYYLLFVVHRRIPSKGVWVRFV